MSRGKIKDPEDLTILSPKELQRLKWRKSQRGSRTNKKVVKEKAAFGREVDLLANVRTHCSKHKFKLIKYGGSKDYRIVALLQSKANPDRYVVQERTIAEGLPSILQNDFDSEREALEDYDVLLTGNRPKNLKWRSLEHYYPQAKAFIISHAAGGTKDREPIWDLGFLYALAELLEFGFESNGFVKKPEKLFNNEKQKRDRANYRRSSLSIVKNQKISKDADDIIEQSKSYCESIAAYAKTASNFIAISAFTGAAMSTISLYPKAFGVVFSEDVFWKNARKIMANHLKTGSNPAGRLKKKKNRPPIEIDHLNEMFALLKNEESVNMLVLNLSTGLRPWEMPKLAANPTKYIVGGDHFNYKGIKLQEHELLVTKNDAQIDVINLVNPKISLISRVILKNKMPCAWIPEPPFYFDSTLRTQEGSPFKRYSEKSIRSTCATMICLCDKIDSVKQGRVTRDVAKERLGHINLNEVTRTYAPRVPTEHPFEYFQMDSLKLDGVMVSDYSALWDTYLLDKWLEWYQKNKRPYYDQIKKLVLQEHAAFPPEGRVVNVSYKKVR